MRKNSMSEEAMSHDNQLLKCGGAELRRMIGAKEISPVELLDAHLLLSTGPARTARASQRFNR
jgi:hypothetical protein